MKQTTELVGQAFARDPAGAQRRLREAFLGDAATSSAVVAFVEARMPRTRVARRARVALWIRNGSHQPDRNTDGAELAAIVRLAIDAEIEPVLVGEAPPSTVAFESAIDLTLHRLDPAFRSDDARRAQLQLFEELRREHALVGQLGVTSAGMDGAALLGLRTAYVTAHPNPRLKHWVGAVAGYEEVLRDERFYERVSELFARWARSDERL